eukprot:15474509-Alexandrium_andersonii.AAC.1
MCIRDSTQLGAVHLQVFVPPSCWLVRALASGRSGPTWSGVAACACRLCNCVFPALLTVFTLA